MRTTRQGLTVLAAVAGVVLAEQPAHAQKRAGGLDDPTIVAIFDAANTWDIETGALAGKRGTSVEVRRFGRMLMRDHAEVRQQGRDLARKLGVHPTPPKHFALELEHRAAMQALRAAKRGEAFDRAFLAHEVAYHKAVIEAVTRTLLPALQNQEVKELVTKVAPAFKAHQDAAQALLDRMGS